MLRDDFWNDPIHRNFVESLTQMQLQALWELLVIASFADEHLSDDERSGLAEALRDLSNFEPELGATEVSRVRAQYDLEQDMYLLDVASRLGDDPTRRGAFRTATQLVRKDGLTNNERDLLSRLGSLLGMEPEVVEFALK